MKTRRDFIKISALGTAGAAVATSAFSTVKAGSLFDWGEKTPLDDSEFIRTATYCEVCFWKCAGWTYSTSKGDIVKILGNEDDPHCNGRLCPRGTGGVGMFTDKDRLRNPLIRVRKEDGKSVFRDASWDEALDLIAKKFKEIAGKHGPESIALFNHGSSGKHFGHLLKAFGSSNITAPSYAQCRGPREVGFVATYGAGVGSPEPTDIRDTECMVLIGSHLGENMHNGQVQEMSEAIDKGATIITVDPRYSTAASKSKFWLPIKPSTDLALLLAWIHVIIYEELYDKEYVKKYTYGFDKLKKHVKNMTPEWAYGITTIKPDIIRKTAREMGDASPAVIVHPGRHVTWYGDDTQRSRAIAILNGLLGSWGRRGGFYLKESIKIPKYPTPKYPKPKWSWKDALDGKYPLAGLSVANGFIDATIPSEENKYQLHAWIVSGTNLPLTMPDKDTLNEAMNALDFMVVVDTMPMEITGYADVVLPECTYLERYDDIRSAPHREPNIALRSPAVKPKYDSKPAWWMAKELGNKLGLEKYFPWNDFEEVISYQLEELGTSLDEMKVIGVKKFDREYGGLYMGDGEDFEFNTNTGKIELFSTELAALGFDPMPKYTEHPEPPSGYYRLIYGRAPMHTFSRTANNQNLVDLMGENNLWVNPKVANIWELTNGQEVWLENQDGAVSKFPIKVRITERIRWDSIYMVHGFGHSNRKLSNAFGKGVNDSELITTVMVDPIMGGTGMRGNFVTFLTEDPGKEIES